MKKVSLSTKIIGLVVTAVFTVGACLFASTYYFVDKGFQDQTQQEIARQADAVQLHFDSITARMAAAAKLTASRRVLAEAIEKGDTAFVQKLGKEVMRDSKAGFITIADKDGNVVGRGHSDKAGDSALSQPNVKKSLAGEASTGIEEGTVVKFSLRAGAPVKVGDKVVGSVTTGVDLTPADHAVVEEVKQAVRHRVHPFPGRHARDDDAHEGRPAGSSARRWTTRRSSTRSSPRASASWPSTRSSGRNTPRLTGP